VSGSALREVTAPNSVIFDVGRVLFDWDLRFLYERLIPNGEALDAFLRDVVTPEWHFQHDAGRPFAETSAELIAQYPHHAEAIGALYPRFNETIGAAMPGWRLWSPTSRRRACRFSRSPISRASSGRRFVRAKRPSSPHFATSSCRATRG
jgi:hypothetical protein